MRAVDTNIVVRYLMNDDRGQALQARGLVDGSEIFVGPTVLLETEWVLRRGYAMRPSQINAAIRQFIGLPTVTVGEPGPIALALDWFDQGMDFADALHLATARHCDGFATFDRDFIKTAARLGAGRVAEP